MHEFSIAKSLLDLVEEEARKHDAKKVVRVELIMGVLSGVEPHLLEIAFEALKEGTMAKDARLILYIEGVSMYCESCKREFEKKEIDFLCPFCGSFNTIIKGGQDLILKSIELE